MGMDMVALIGHDLNKEAAINLPQMIDQWSEVKDLYFKIHPSAKENLVFHRPSTWELQTSEMTPEMLERIWKGNAVDDLNTPMWNNIDTYFADIGVFKNAINVSPNPEHKYGNLRNPIALNYIISLMRLIAKRLNSEKIIYCVDSYVSTSILWEKANQGLTIDEIIAFGNEKFGVPPKEINEAIGNHYFVDEFDLTPEDFDLEKKVFNRCDHEYWEAKKLKNE